MWHCPTDSKFRLLGGPVSVNISPGALCEWEQQGWLMCFKHHFGNTLEIVDIN